MIDIYRNCRQFIEKEEAKFCDLGKCTEICYKLRAHEMKIRTQQGN